MHILASTSAQSSQNPSNECREHQEHLLFCTWSSTPVADTELLSPMEFLGRYIGVSCSSGSTVGGLLDSFRAGAGHQKDQAMHRSLKLSAPHPSSGKGDGAGG